MAEKMIMKAKTLILIVALILCCLLFGCSKKEKADQNQPQTERKQTIEADEQEIDTRRLDAEGIPPANDVADPRLKKAIDKTLDSRSGERRPRDD